MCNGSSSRTSQGGSIAVLRPTRHLRRSPTDDMTLFFRNQFASSGTHVELQGWNPSTPHGSGDGGHWVVIQ